MENSTKTLLKVYLASQIFTGVFFNCVFFQFSSKKILLIAEYLLLLMQMKFSMVKRWKFAIRYYFNACTLASLFAVGKILPFTKTNKRFYRCRSIPLYFYIYCTCWEAYFHDNIKSDNRYFMAKCTTTRSAWIFKLKFLKMRSSTCNGNALFIEIKLYALYNIPNENKGLICGGVMRGEILNSTCLDFFWNSLFEVVFILNFTFAVFCYHVATLTLRFHN